MAFTREEVMRNNLISMEVLDEIPELCECGSPIEFTETVRQVYCSNPRCYCKVASRLEKMAKAMEVDGFGESTCVQLCRTFKMISPFQVFLLKGRGDLGISGVAAINKKIEDICNEERRKIKLWELVKYAGIPDIEGNAAKIFSGYDNLEDAYRDIESGQVPFVAEKLGIKRAESAVMAVKIYNNLMEFKGELFFGEMQFSIVKETGTRMKIAITGGVFGFNNKGQFIKYLNSRYEGRLNAMLASSVTSEVDILISDAGDESGKLRNANKINRKYIENAVTSGEIRAEDIGKFKSESDLHPIGEKILICNHVRAIEVLDRVLGYSEVQS